MASTPRPEVSRFASPPSRPTIQRSPAWAKAMWVRLRVGVRSSWGAAAGAVAAASRRVARAAGRIIADSGMGVRWESGIPSLKLRGLRGGAKGRLEFLRFHAPSTLRLPRPARPGPGRPCLASNCPARAEAARSRGGAAGLFVAGAPGPELLAGLKAAGVTVVLNLRQDAEGDFTAEQRKVEEAGLRYDRCLVGREPDAEMLDAFRRPVPLAAEGPLVPRWSTASPATGSPAPSMRSGCWTKAWPREAALALAKRAGLTNPATEAVKAYVATRLNL